MGKYYLAVDMGASSGRHILGHLENGKMVLEEIYRFENGMQKVDGHLCWDTKHLSKEIIAGLKKCKELGKIPEYMGIDTWGVDYVLLDKDDQVLGRTYGYRDKRTDDMDLEVAKIIHISDLYARNGIQKTTFNTIYQLMAHKYYEPELLSKAETLLQTPDYYNFVLTGKKKSEYTMATTGQLVDPNTNDWDYELIEMLGFPRKIFIPLTPPGTIVGHFTDEVAKEVGFQCTVMQIASHDTASAVMAVPAPSGEALYISSGTWSLLGTEIKKPICTKESENAHFTNEGGYDYRFRYLTNIMGLWMIQSVRHETGDAYSFAQLCDMAEESRNFPSRVDVNDQCFMAPDNMTEEIKSYCKRTNQQVPETIGEIATVIYQSLAECYARMFDKLEEVTGNKYDAVNIVGGGSNADYLNRLTKEKSGRTIYAGPGEATAIGNIAAQMIEAGELADLVETRKCIFDSFGVKEY